MFLDPFFDVPPGVTALLSITGQQFRTLGRASFQKRMIGLIREDYPNQAASMTDDALGEEIWRQVERAARYKLGDEQSVAVFVITAWLLGPGFDERIPAMKQVVDSPELSSAGKAKALSDFTELVFGELARQSARG